MANFANSEAEVKTYEPSIREYDGKYLISFSTEKDMDIKSLFNKEYRETGINLLANWMKLYYNVNTLKGIKNEEMYIYRDGIYMRQGKTFLEKEIEKILNKKATTNLVTEIINKIKRISYIDREDFFKNDTNLICFENGIFDLKKKELMPFSPNYVFLSKVPIKYKSDEDCIEIKKFLNDILYEEDIKVIQEWCGFMLYRNYFVKKAMILVGEKDTGKTTFLNLLTKFIGLVNVSGISIQRIAYDKFATANLFGKLLNSYDDLSEEDIRDVGRFKMATGNGYLDAEYKFADAFQFKNYAKLIFATNKIPEVKSEIDDKAYYGRWIVILFDNVFDDANENTDKFLIDKLTTEKEMSGFLNFALEGLDRILKNGKFSYDKSPQQIKEVMGRFSDSVTAFFQDCVRNASNEWVSKDALFERYKKYCTMLGLPIRNKIAFGRVVKNYWSVYESRKDVTTGWKGISFTEELSITEKEKQKV